MKKILALAAIIINCLVTFIGCSKSHPAKTTATVTTTSVSSITDFTASSGGTVTSDGGDKVTARGVCWNITGSPTADITTRTMDDAGTGRYVSSIIGLNSGTTYYMRAYATNSFGTAYGNQISFTTSTVHLDSILGTYMGIVHFTYTFSNPSNPSSDTSLDTTYSFKFIVSKVFKDTFTTNKSYTASAFMGGANNNIGYQSSNVYFVNYSPSVYPIGGNGWGNLMFSPTSDSAWYSVNFYDAEGGGRVFSVNCTESFYGKKM